MEPKTTKNRSKKHSKNWLIFWLIFYRFLDHFWCHVGLQNRPKIEQKWVPKQWPKKATNMRPRWANIGPNKRFSRLQTGLTRARIPRKDGRAEGSLKRILEILRGTWQELGNETQHAMLSLRGGRRIYTQLPCGPALPPCLGWRGKDIGWNLAPLGPKPNLKPTWGQLGANLGQLGQLEPT